MCVWVQSERTARCTLTNIKLSSPLLKNIRHSHTSCTLLQNNNHQGHGKVCPRQCSPSSSGLGASTCKKIFNCCAERCAREQPADHRNDKCQADSQAALLSNMSFMCLLGLNVTVERHLETFILCPPRGDWRWSGLLHARHPLSLSPPFPNLIILHEAVSHADFFFKLLFQRLSSEAAKLFYPPPPPLLDIFGMQPLCI